MAKPEPLLSAGQPEFENLDLLLPDLNGICRGKRIPKASADKVYNDGVLLPRSVYASNVCGDTVDETGIGISTGDQDYECFPEVETLRPIPWSQDSAQCIMEMRDTDGEAFFASPRHRLRNIVRQLHAMNVFPTVAVELEFYLFRNGLDEHSMPRHLIDPVTGQEEHSTQVYSMDDLDSCRPFIETIQAYCEAQSVPASAAIAEYAPGQFEINLNHKSDPLGACDDAIYLKRIIRQAAKKHGMHATFMAKPVADQAGSGMHIHTSLYDGKGNNLCVANEQVLRHAIGGLQATMAEAALLWAPHANSYRRYQKGCYVPLSPTWGYNNRSVALRIPAGPESALRIEHRVSGADASPYLAMAGVLAGILHGLRESIEPDQPIEGDATEQREASLTTDWFSAIKEFGESGWVAEYFGKDFQSLLTSIKLDEYAEFQRQVSPLDVSWYLQTV